MTMQHIETYTVGAESITEIELSSIPQDYTDLLLLVSIRNSSTSTDYRFELNNSVLNFSNVYLFGNGSSASSNNAYGNYLGLAPTNATTANTFGSFQLYLSNYTASQAKSVSIDSVSENNGSTAYQLLNAALWDDTSAVNSITVYHQAGQNIAEHSSISLYGITAGGDGTVSTA